MTEREWKQTPYAESRANDPDNAIANLLEKYRITVHQISQVKGPCGRPAIVLRFIFREQAYRIAFEVLDAANVEMTRRIKQVKRVMYWMLKVRLEEAGVFGSPEELMCGWLELPDGKTVFEASKPYIKQLPGADYATKVFGLLPSAEKK